MSDVKTGYVGRTSFGGGFGATSPHMDGLKIEGTFIPAKIVVFTLIPGMAIGLMKNRITMAKYPKTFMSGCLLTIVGTFSLCWNIIQRYQE